ncbi:hypothetical protein GPECTOR_20phG10 [Gonium pectorale]|uniref:Pherophorin domain-containing protein n=1 Tax=Gonium pectorale TaxID=33097 RepID=A0A150GIU1_GONPE|nr:hypothetical protein GPECTOR_20phG10 [Gonium pectorale]|eukprot:KXZ49739.1 hypothetical protein GPECTOR_20phG10 [Gonium pectorale]
MGHPPLRRLQRGLLAVLLLGTLASTGLAQEVPGEVAELLAEDTDRLVDPTLAGGDPAALNRFPFCQCSDYRCSTSPYRLISIGSPSGRTDELCYLIERVGCSQANPCCKKLLESLGKVEVSVDKACKPDYTGSWVNGIKRNSYFDTDFATGKIRITPLGMNVASATNSTVCFRFKAGSPCTTYSNLCANAAGMCTYAVFESSSHVCCPVCAQALPPPPPFAPAILPKCDCISSFIQTTSRFRLDYLRSIVTADFITYMFNLYVIRPQDCFASGYRGGSCCNQTLVNIGLSLEDSIRLDDLGDATLTTDTGYVMRVSKQRTFWGVKLFPNDLTRGRDYTPSLFVTNFTDGKPWTLSLSVAVDANPSPRPGKWPCKPSRYLPDDRYACDIMLNGYQTANGRPTTILNITDFEIPNCCPEGVLRFGQEDSCCVDNLAENPYRMAFNNTSPSVKDDTVFSFKLSHTGKSARPTVWDPYRPNCSVSEVDQVTLFVAPETLNYVYKVTVDGKEVDFTRSKNNYQSWIRAINLHKVTKTPSVMDVFMSADLTANQVCTTKVAESTLCEYMLKGAYDDAVKEYTCCPHGATAISAASCPA